MVLEEQQKKLFIYEQVAWLQVLFNESTAEDFVFLIKLNFHIIWEGLKIKWDKNFVDHDVKSRN